MNTRTSILSALFVLAIIPLMSCQLTPNQNLNNTTNIPPESVQTNTKRIIMTETWIYYGLKGGRIDQNNIQREEKFRYNEKGNLVENTLRFGGVKEGVDLRTVCTFKNSNKTEEIKYTYYSGDIRREVFTYNSKNQIAESLLYFNKDTYPGRKYLWIYNNSGKLIEKQHLSYLVRMENVDGNWVERFYPETELTSRLINKYDSKNFLIEETNYDIDSKKGETIDTRLVYLNDEEGNPTQISKYDGVSLNKVTKKVYKSGLLVDERNRFYYASGEISGTNHYQNKYNEDREIIEQITFDDKEIPTSICKISHEYY